MNTKEKRKETDAYTVIRDNTEIAFNNKSVQKLNERVILRKMYNLNKYNN